MSKLANGMFKKTLSIIIVFSATQTNELPPPASIPPDPVIIKLRSKEIAKDIEAIRQECPPGGDWDKWLRNTTPMRIKLKQKVDALSNLPPAKQPRDINYKVMTAKDNFPLVEVGARERIFYLYNENSLDGFRKDRSVIASSRWLHLRGIDLIFVAIPKMTEVYIEHFIDTPADGIIAPHARKTLLELLQNDVEVIDGFRLFRPCRSRNPDYLYMPADTHWNQRGMQVMAREVARRLQRYKVGNTKSVITKVIKTPIDKIFQDGFDTMDIRQIAAAKTVSKYQEKVVMVNGDEPADDPNSSVLLIGHSYVRGFRERLVRQLNCTIRSHWGLGKTTEAFGEFLREPELLDGIKVVVWITTEQHMVEFRKLPEEIAKLGKDKI